jgi:hypothetical protein
VQEILKTKELQKETFISLIIRRRSEWCVRQLWQLVFNPEGISFYDNVITQVKVNKSEAASVV